MRVIWQDGDRFIIKTFRGDVSYEQVDRIAEKHGWKAIIIDYPQKLSLNNILNALSDFLMGLYYGYPPCCILAFCIDEIFDRGPPNALKWTSKTDYVPCKRCLKRLGGPEPIPEGTF